MLLDEVNEGRNFINPLERVKFIGRLSSSLLTNVFVVMFILFTRTYQPVDRLTNNIQVE